MKVSEVMTSDVQTVSADQTAREAASFMLRAEAGSIPVCEGEKVIGMITDREIAVRGVAEGRGPDTPVPVGERSTSPSAKTQTLRVSAPASRAGPVKIVP